MTHRFIHHLALFGSCAFLGLCACDSVSQLAAQGSEPGARIASAGRASVEQNEGSVEVALKLGNAQLDSLSYTVVGSGFATSGSLDVSHSSKVSGIIGGIPFGTNYALTMTGKGSSAAPLDCSGSTSFNLNSVGPIPVTIAINCKEPDVVEPPPPTAMPAPVPPFAVLALGCALAALGVAAQRRRARG